MNRGIHSFDSVAFAEEPQDTSVEELLGTSVVAPCTAVVEPLPVDHKVMELQIVAEADRSSVVLVLVLDNRLVAAFVASEAVR
jgi:hypothetical protein